MGQIQKSGALTGGASIAQLRGQFNAWRLGSDGATSVANCEIDAKSEIFVFFGCIRLNIRLTIKYLKTASGCSPQTKIAFQIDLLLAIHFVFGRPFGHKQNGRKVGGLPFYLVAGCADVQNENKRNNNFVMCSFFLLRCAAFFALFVWRINTQEYDENKNTSQADCVLDLGIKFIQRGLYCYAFSKSMLDYFHRISSRRFP